MWRVKWILLGTLAMLACSTTLADARIQAGDATATHAYLKARIALNRAMTADEPAVLKAITVLETQVKVECPGVLAGAPPHVKGEKTNQSQFEITEELLTVTFGAGERVEHPAAVRFAATVRHLRWSNPRLTKLLRSLAIEQAVQSAIRPPDLCSDLKFWVTSGYSTTSPGTKTFLHRLSVVSSITLIESEPHEPVSNFFNTEALVAYRLKPYENRADRRLAKRALPPDVKITNPALKPLFEAVGGIYAALGRTAAPAALVLRN
jgi:hypothetical protein